MLILECSDISSILKTIERNSPSATDRFQYLQEEAVNRVGRSTDFSQGSFDFHISNADPAALARIVVLLMLARILDPDRPEELELFWAVWGNCLLTRAQFQSFQAVAMTLAGGDCFHFEVSGLKIPNRDDLAKVRRIWAAWAACENLPSTQTVMGMRFKRMSSMDTVGRRILV